MSAPVENPPAEAALWVHLFVEGYKRTQSGGFLDQTLEEMNALSNNWFLRRRFPITYAPVAGLRVEVPRTTMNEGDENHFSLVVRDGQKIGLPPVDGVFCIQAVEDWTFSVGDQIYRATCEIEVDTRDQARSFYEQLMKGYGFEDISRQVLGSRVS